MTRIEKPKINKDQLIYKLNNINVLSFTYNNNTSIDKEFKRPLFKYNYEIKTSCKKENRVFIINITIKVFYRKDEKILSDLSVDYIYGIDDPNNIIFKDKEYFIPDDLLLTFISIAISTTRGILFEKCRGTLIQEEPFPLIGHKALLELIKSKK